MTEKAFIENIGNSFLDNHKGLDDIEIRVGSPEELFGEKGKSLGDFQGAFFPKSRIVAVNNEAINSLEGLEKTLRHELIGHAGINTFSPDDKAKLLDAITHSPDKEIQEQRDQLKKLYPNHDDNRLAEEVFATISETEYDVPVRFNESIRADNLSMDNLKAISKYVSEGLKTGQITQQTFPESDQAQFQKTGKKEPYYETVANKLIEQLEQGTAPWQKPWEASFDAIPHNAVTGNRYKGINALHLSMQGRSDPRWLTYKQAQSVNAQVRKGEKGTRIEYYKFEEEKLKRDENGKPVLDADGNKVKIKIKLDTPRVFSATVFNAEQVDGLPELENKSKEMSWEEVERVEKILNNSGVPLHHDQSDSAYYIPSKDEIHLPKKEQFDDAGKYYATALHELGHSTGHPSRLDRDLSGRFGSESYAKEELRAEISSLMTGTELGVGHDPGQHAAYVKSWIKVLKDDPKEILIASKDAEKITNLVLSYEKEKSQSITSEQIKSSEVSEAFKSGVEKAISATDYDNPYHPSSPEFKEFSAGFNNAKREITDSIADRIYSEKKEENPQLSEAFKQGIKEAILPSNQFDNPYPIGSPEYKEFNNGLHQTQKAVPIKLAKKFTENFKTEDDKNRFIEQVQKQLENKIEQPTLNVKIKEPTQPDMER